MIAQNHQRVEQKVRHFLDNFLSLASLGGDKDFPGFFRDLFKDPIVTRLKELARVRAWLGRGLASRNDPQHALENTAVRL